MYLSHTVRSIRTDPHPDASVGLVVEVDDDASAGAESGSGAETESDTPPSVLADAVAETDGTIERDLGFDAWLVVVPETAIDSLCDLDSVVRIETDATISLNVETLSAEAKAALDAAATDADPTPSSHSPTSSEDTLEHR